MLKKPASLSLITSLITLGAIFSGCTQSPYVKNYIPNQTLPQIEPKDSLNFASLPTGETPEIILSSNLERDSGIMLSKHYVPVGSSAFIGTLQETDGVLKQAKKINALVALYSVDYSRTTEILTTEHTPMQTVFIGNGFGFGGGMGMGFGFSNGFSRTSSQLIRLYDQKAIFYVKDLTPNHIGIQASEISREQRIALGKNGFIVDIIFERGAAIYSDIMVNDIILSIDGVALENQDIFYEQLKGFTKDKTTHSLIVLRDKVEREIIIKN